MAHHEPLDCICTEVAPIFGCWCDCHEPTHATSDGRTAWCGALNPRISSGGVSCAKCRETGPPAPKPVGPYEVRDRKTLRLIGVCSEQDRDHWEDSGYLVALI